MVLGFMLISRRRAISPYDNPISVWDMQRLLKTAENAGVDLDTIRLRTKESGSGIRRSVAASLGESLSSNEGWYVYPEEAKELAELLPAAAESSGDPLFIRQMVKFFEKAAKYGGFFVF